MELILEIDYREKGIIKCLESMGSSVNIIYKVSNLIIGDFILKQLEVDSSSETIHYIIERKTILDLSSSITDGRFREQKQRLLESIGNPDKIIYILEGNKGNKKYGSISKTTIESSILNLIFKHKYKVICTDNEQNTLDMLLSLYKKIQTKEFEKVLTSTPFKAVKKNDNFDVFTHMLSVIPGVSITFAKKIKDVYKTFPLLLDSYSKLNTLEEKYKMLNNIQVTDKRKLGNVLSKKIYNSIFEMTENKENTENTENDICLL
jgi:crossover junction endonuclease MUS81